MTVLKGHISRKHVALPDDDEEETIGGVFDDILRQYGNQCEWMVTRLVSGAADAIKPLFDDYRTKERYTRAKNN